MITRRKFVQLSAAALPALASPLRAQSHFPIGVQLYTVRQLAEKNLPQVLRQIRAIGYQQVELIPQVYTYSPGDLRKLIADSGLTVPSSHFSYEELPSRFQYAKDLGLKWMVCPVLPGKLRSSADGFQQAALKFNSWGKRARDMGMRVAFHNHDYEFQKFGGSTGYEILVKNSDPELVFFEMDCYWIAQSGNDPVQMMRKLGKRVRLLHLKDRKPGFPPSTKMDAASAHFTEIGSGTLDWPGILAQARKLGVEYYFVEQDHTDGPPMESIRKSYNYLARLTAKS